jgi:hypothetical protein
MPAKDMSGCSFQVLRCWSAPPLLFSKTLFVGTFHLDIEGNSWTLRKHLDIDLLYKLLYFTNLIYIRSFGDFPILIIPMRKISEIAIIYREIVK